MRIKKYNKKSINEDIQPTLKKKRKWSIKKIINDDNWIFKINILKNQKDNKIEFKMIMKICFYFYFRDMK